MQAQVIGLCKCRVAGLAHPHGCTSSAGAEAAFWTASCRTEPSLCAMDVHPSTTPPA